MAILSDRVIVIGVKLTTKIKDKDEQQYGRNAHLLQLELYFTPVTSILVSQLRYESHVLHIV